MNSFKAIKAILLKDIRYELHGKQTLPSALIMAALISWIFRLALTQAQASHQTVAAAVLLVGILLTVVLTSEKLFALEQQNGCIDALLMAGVDPSSIYIAKLIANLILLMAFQIVIIPVIIVLFDVGPIIWPRFLLTVLLFDIGITAIATLLGAAVQTARSASGILTIMILTIAAPLMLPAVFAITSTMQPNQIEQTLPLITDFRTALVFLASFDIIYLTACWLLFDFIVSE